MRRTTLFLLISVLVACGGGAAGTSASTQARPVRGPANLITEAEINASVYQNAYEAIRNLRPDMLIPRGTSTSAVPVIAYMDDVRLTDLSALSTIPANRVREIRYINSRDATTRWGTGHGSGVVLVLTKR